MKKAILIEGMSCNHCKATVEKALNALDGVSNATVDLQSKKAVIDVEPSVSDELILETVSDLNFNPISIDDL